MRYPENTIYISGSGKTAEANPISKINNLLVVTLILERTTGKILSAEINASCQNTRDFVGSILEGQNFYDINSLVETVSSRYFGTSRKTIIAALRDAYDKLGQRALPFYPEIPPCRKKKRSTQN